MNKIKAYVKKNFIFVALLTIIVVITAGLAIFYIVNNPSEAADPEEHDKTKPVTQKSDTQISSFDGVFTNDASVKLTWGIAVNKQKVTRVDLYHGDNLIAAVSDLNTYVLPLNAYQFATGENEFTLKVVLADDKIIEKKTKVNVDPVFDASCNVENTTGGVLIKVSYKYGSANPVRSPTINAINTYGNPFSISYVDTIKGEQEGAYTNATTIYFLDTSKMSSGAFNYNIRFIFKDVSLSFDFPVTVNVQKEIVPPQENEADKNNPSENENQEDTPNDQEDNKEESGSNTPAA